MSAGMLWTYIYNNELTINNKDIINSSNNINITIIMIKYNPEIRRS